MRAKIVAIVCLGIAVVLGGGWGSGVASAEPAAAAYFALAQEPEQEQEQEKDSKEEKAQEEKTPEKEKKKKPRTSEGLREEKLNRRAISRVIRNFSQTIEQQSPANLQRIVDDKKFFDFPRFEDGVTQFLSSVGEMRLFLREVNVELDGEKAVMVIDAEMRYSDRDDATRNQSRREQIEFTFHRGERSWKITEIKPRTFFLP
jgi:hypothetical protein